MGLTLGLALGLGLGLGLAACPGEDHHVSPLRGEHHAHGAHPPE